MDNLVVLGTQWGDEGKGKIIDLLSPSFDIIARYQGGHNAGHTVYVNGRKIVLHLLPSGILHPGKICVIGNGVVIHPQALLDEMAELERFGAEIGDRLIIGLNAHLIMPYHPLVEEIGEKLRGDEKIGTTCRGIGPAYQDKAARIGLRMGDLLDETSLRSKIALNVKEKNVYLEYFGKKPLDEEEIFREYIEYAFLIGRHIRDVSFFLNREMAAGRRILFEGAQGALLDIDHGTYPYVTSSNSTSGGVCTGLGVSPDKIHSVLGVTKAYSTRVGGGPFPTEISGEIGRFFLEKGREFGATTGRPRRCGWFDGFGVAYACRINGIRNIVLTKADIMDGLEEINICTGYRYQGALLDSFPVESRILEKVTPEYKTLPGWKNPVRKRGEYTDLPQEFKDYVHCIEDLIEAKAAIISTGVEREDTIFVNGTLEESLQPS